MGNLFVRFPGGKRKALTLSYDDAIEQDIKLLDIMKSFGLKGTFNLNSSVYAKPGTIYEEGNVHRIMTQEQVTEAYSGSGQEVALHGATHPFLEQLPTHLVIQDMVKDRLQLEKQFGRIVRGMAYPYGTFNEDVIRVLKDIGVAYARTVISTEDFRLPTDWLKLTATCHHNNPRLMELAGKFVNEKPFHSSWLFYLWGHSYEFEQNDNWEVIEKFGAYVQNKEDIWYATNIEIYEYIEDYKRLIFSMDGTRVQNPSARTIFFSADADDYEIKAGEEIIIKRR